MKTRHHIVWTGPCPLFNFFLATPCSQQQNFFLSRLRMLLFHLVLIYQSKKCCCIFTDINECLSNPCLNDGKCENKINSYSCECVNGYTGNRCQNAPPKTGSTGTFFDVGHFIFSTSLAISLIDPCGYCIECFRTSNQIFIILAVLHPSV